jgi:hypothetical protein
MITIMVVRGIGIRNISTVLRISITKVLKVLKSTKYRIKPKKTPYDCLELDEFWTYGGTRRTRCGLYTPITGEAGLKNGSKTEEADTTAWDKLSPDSDGWLEELLWSMCGRMP